MVKLTPNASNGLVKACAADALQIRSLDERRFVRCRGVLSAEEMDDVVAAIIIVLNIPIGSPGS
jgi:mRNA interferase MazF